MRFHSRNFSVVVAGWLLASAVPASADLIQFTFEGSMISSGDSYSLSYQFDSNTVDMADLNPALGDYVGAIRSFSFSINGTPEPGVFMGGDIQVREIELGVWTYAAGMSTDQFGVGVELVVDTLTNDLLPTDLALSGFTINFGPAPPGGGQPGPPLSFFNGNNEASGGNIMSFSSRVVPVPGSAVLGVVGCGLVGWLRRRNLT